MKKRKKELSAATCLAALDYLDKYKIDYSSLLKKLPYSKEYLKNIFNWIDVKTMVTVAEFIFEKFGTYEVWYDIFKESSIKRRRGILDFLLIGMVTPARVILHINNIMSSSFDRTVEIEILQFRNGYCRMKMNRSTDNMPAKISQFYSGIANISSIVNFFSNESGRIVPVEVDMPIYKMGPMKGKIYELKKGWIYEKDLRTKKTKKIGKENEDGTFEYKGVLYGVKGYVLWDLYWEPLSIKERFVRFIDAYKLIRNVKRSTMEMNELLKSQLVQIESLNAELVKEYAELDKIEKEIEANNKKLNSEFTKKCLELDDNIKQRKIWEVMTVKKEDEIKKLKEELEKIA